MRYLCLMSGIYFHIPFCKQACHYCNFHFSTSLRLKEGVISAMLKELEARRDYLPETSLSSIYFGGGTPSLLDEQDIDRFFKHIERYFTIEEGAEITLEANPDDLDHEKLKMLANSPINRLSIGIQSFKEEDLTFMNRAHNAKEARHCIDDALKMGFKDFSIDLIYGSPTTSDEDWATNLAIALDYNTPHLSCYALTVEEKTALHHFVATGKSPAVDEEKAARQFQYLMNTAKSAGYQHYEISNFALPGRYAKHNTSYWQRAPYLGIGPAAHSFNGLSRQWNIANNALYIKALEATPPLSFFEEELLSKDDRYNEYIMTGLRTMWGVNLAQIKELGEQYASYFQKHSESLLKEGTLRTDNATFYLSDEGRLLADGIAASLFV
jgi:oxygen-independent coproporphyrinogen-3 oxidase